MHRSGDAGLGAPRKGTGWFGWGRRALAPCGLSAPRGGHAPTPCCWRGTPLTTMDVSNNIPEGESCVREAVVPPSPFTERRARGARFERWGVSARWLNSGVVPLPGGGGGEDEKQRACSPTKISSRLTPNRYYYLWRLKSLSYHNSSIHSGSNASETSVEATTTPDASSGSVLNAAA